MRWERVGDPSPDTNVVRQNGAYLTRMCGSVWIEFGRIRFQDAGSRDSSTCFTSSISQPVHRIPNCGGAPSGRESITRGVCATSARADGVFSRGRCAAGAHHVLLGDAMADERWLIGFCSTHGSLHPIPASSRNRWSVTDQPCGQWLLALVARRARLSVSSV